MDRSQHATVATATLIPGDVTGFPPPASQVGLAASMIGLGVLGFIHGDVAMVWQHLPIEHLPGAVAIAYVFALIELACGIGLLLRPWAKTASAVLAAFMLMWAVLLKLPAVLIVPQMEATWLGLGEITVILAGTWILFACHVGERGRGPRWLVGQRGIRAARVLFALSLPAIGLSHFFYTPQTIALMPAWLPFHVACAYLTGACSILACLGVLFGVLPKLAATLEAVMLGIITLVIWGPAILAQPMDRTAWTAFVISAAIACGAWVVADSYRVPRHLAS